MVYSCNNLIPKKPVCLQQVKPNGGVWPKIRNINNENERLWRSISEGIRMEVGDDRKIRFWDDVWLEYGRLRETYPRWHSLSNQKDCFIGDCGFWDGLEWIWNFN